MLAKNDMFMSFLKKLYYGYNIFNCGAVYILLRLCSRGKVKYVCCLGV